MTQINLKLIANGNCSNQSIHCYLFEDTAGTLYFTRVRNIGCLVEINNLMCFIAKIEFVDFHNRHHPTEILVSKIMKIFGTGTLGVQDPDWFNKYSKLLQFNY